MKKFFTTNDLIKFENVKGEIIFSKGNKSLIKRVLGDLICYTVWNHEENFIFCNTPSEIEALKTFIKYT